MTYFPRGALGALAISSEDACSATANAKTAEIDRLTEDFAGSWRPTGFYRVPDLTRMRDQVFAALKQASDGVDKAVAAGAPFDIRLRLRDAQGQVQKKMSEMLPFTQAIHAANAKGIQVLDAPSFKRWVIESLVKISVATGYVAYVSCLKPGIVAALQAITAACRALIELGKSLASATIAIGEQILKVPDHLETLWTFTKWGVLAVAAFYAIRPRRQNPCRSPRR